MQPWKNKSVFTIICSSFRLCGGRLCSDATLHFQQQRIQSAAGTRKPEIGSGSTIKANGIFLSCKGNGRGHERKHKKRAYTGRAGDNLLANRKFVEKATGFLAFLR